MVIIVKAFNFDSFKLRGKDVDIKVAFEVNMHIGKVIIIPSYSFVMDIRTGVLILNQDS